MKEAVERANLWGPQQAVHFPVIMRSGVLMNGKAVHYVMNHSASPTEANYQFPAGKDLLSSNAVRKDSAIALPPWGTVIVEEGTAIAP
jgi:beta-galactosidase